MTKRDEGRPVGVLERPSANENSIEQPDRNTATPADSTQSQSAGRPVRGYYGLTDQELDAPVTDIFVNVGELPRIFWEGRTVREFLELRDGAYNRDAQVIQYQQEYGPDLMTTEDCDSEKGGVDHDES